MDADEREIFQFLKTSGGEFVAAAEVARRAGGKRRFHENPEWARPFLTRMTERNILEADPQDRFRIKPPMKKGSRWVSPHIAKILKEKGIKVEEAYEPEIGTDEYYDQL